MHYFVAYDINSNHQSPLEWTVKNLYKSRDFITVVTIVQDVEDALTGTEDMVRSQIQSSIHQLETQYGPLNIQIHVVVDTNPGECILQKVNELQPNLVILGSRGRSKLTSLVLGSVSLFVLENATTPITILKSE